MTTAIVACSLLAQSCSQPEVSPTRGTAVVACDESLVPVMQFQAEDFHNTYVDASIVLQVREAREAVVDFVNDSIRTMVIARPFNREELDVLKNANIEYEAYTIALDAVAVIVNGQNRDTTLRITALDSMFNGTTTRWGAGKGSLIDAYVGDINSSSDEVFKAQVLGGKPFSPTVSRMKTSADIIESVRKSPDAIGIVGLSWLQGRDEGIRVCRLGGGSYQPDSTVVPGQFFSPAQAHLLRKYYPITRELHMYTREPRRNAAYGFIAYVKDRKGQQNFVNRGLVPTAMPVRLVTTTSEKVQ